MSSGEASTGPGYLKHVTQEAKGFKTAWISKENSHLPVHEPDLRFRCGLGDQVTLFMRDCRALLCPGLHIIQRHHRDVLICGWRSTQITENWEIFFNNYWSHSPEIFWARPEPKVDQIRANKTTESFFFNVMLMFAKDQNSEKSRGIDCMWKMDTAHMLVHEWILKPPFLTFLAATMLVSGTQKWPCLDNSVEYSFIS